MSHPVSAVRHFVNKESSVSLHLGYSARRHIANRRILAAAQHPDVLECPLTKIKHVLGLSTFYKSFGGDVPNLKLRVGSI